MKLNELKPSHVKGLNKLESYDDFNIWLKENNFRSIGSGLYATVYGSDDSKLVLKTTHEDFCYDHFADFAAKNRHITYIPRVVKKVTDKGFTVYIIEKLDELIGIEKDYLEALLNYLHYFFAKSSKEERRNQFYRFLGHIEDSERFYNDMQFLLKIARMVRVIKKDMPANCGLDLHSGNIMKRGNQYVFTDPFLIKI